MTTHGQTFGPVAEVKGGRLQWIVARDNDKFLNNDTHPLFDQAAIDAAVAAERERCARLCDERVRRAGTIGRQLEAQECATAIRSTP